MRYKFYVINLDSSSERLARVEAEFAKKGLEFERVSAVNGKALTAQEKAVYSETLNRKHYYKPLLNAEIACYLSHIKCWKKIVDENLDYGVVFEDDIFLNDEMKSVPAVIESIKTKWDFLKLINPFNKKRIVSRLPLGSFGGKAFELIKWSKLPIGFEAVVISQACAKRLLDIHKEIYRPVDVDMQYFWEHKLAMFGLLPEAVYHEEGIESTIQSRKEKYHYPLARFVYKFKYALKRILK